MPGKFRAITIDLGISSVGTLLLGVAGAKGGEIVDIHYHQHLRQGRPEFPPLGAGCMVAFASRFRPASGSSHHEFFHLMGARHLTLVLRDSACPLTLSVSWRSALYPFTMQGRFSCSDEVLNRIHDSCRLTQQICALDAYVDTPWREQAQWWGDARVQARNTFYLDGDARLLARGIRSIAGQTAPQGLTYGHAPTCSGWCILPDFSLTWILTIWDHYWQTGDLSLFREQHPRIKQILAYFESPEARASNGLLVNDPRFWLFEDWADLPRDRFPVFLNLWHLYTLEHYARLLQAAGLDRQYTAMKSIVKTRRKLVSRHCFDTRQGLFHASLDNAGRPVGEPSVHDQVLAILLNLRPEAHDTMLSKRLLPSIKEKSLTCAVPSAFWSTMLFECLQSKGLGEAVLKFIRKKWSPMVSTGTTWEQYDWDETSGASCTHAWTAHPSYHFVNILAGLNQTAPAWKTVRWSPLFPKGIRHAEATVPTPQGLLKTAWRRKGKSVDLSLDVPPGIMVTAELPGQPIKKLRPGRHTSILALSA